MTPSPIRVLVIDDHPLYRDGVVRILDSQPDIVVVGSGGDLASAQTLARTSGADLALVDVSMPGGGIAAARTLVACGIHVAMLTASEADDDVLSALDSGATGYVLKGVGGDELVQIVRIVARGGSYVAPSLAAHLLSALSAPRGTPTHSPLDDLTKREADVLRLVARGHSNKEIGRALDLQEKTVKHYMTAIMQKLQVRNRVEAAVMARPLLD